MHVWVYQCVYVCVHWYVCLYGFMCVYVYISVCVSVSLVSLCVCVSNSVCIYVSVCLPLWKKTREESLCKSLRKDSAVLSNIDLVLITVYLNCFNVYLMLPRLVLNSRLEVVSLPQPQVAGSVCM